MARFVLTTEDRNRIAAAVAAAERGTSGEIRCVIADDADPMRAALVAGCIALVAPAAGLLFGNWPLSLVDAFDGWTIAHDQAPAAMALLALQIYAAGQALVLVLALAVALSPVPRWLTPAALREARVDKGAKAQFAALGLADTRDRTGVLLYVSLGHHWAGVLADDGIYAKAPLQAWDEVVALLTGPLRRGRIADGLVAAVEKVGELLATHLPPRADDRNELPDAPTLTR